MSETAAPAAPAAASRPLGKPRGVGKVILLTIVTIGIYGIIWIWKSFNEVKAYRGQGIGGFLGFLSCFVLAGYFLLPSAVGQMYKEDGRTDAPVGGASGFWIFLPYVGTFVWMAKVQGALNRFWESKGAPAP
jgi:drug/metabolite transporter (DMT)-like permease